MTTLAQRKALEFVFCEPITEGLWDRLMNNRLTDNDELCDTFIDNQDIKTLVKDLSINFQEVFEEGYMQGKDNTVWSENEIHQ